jgi:hypothetical protein
MAENQSFPGFFGLTDSNSKFNHDDFHISQKLARSRTAVPVKIMDVTPSADGLTYTVDVQPMVKQVDGVGNSVSHGTIHGIPHANGSGGNGAAIIKPKKGDMGLMVVCDRDISGVIANKGEATPGSGRMHDLSDGVYLGGFAGMNGTPAQYVSIDENGIHLKAATIFVDGNLAVTGAITATQEVTAKSGSGSSVTLSQHTHGGGPHPDPGT